MSKADFPEHVQNANPGDLLGRYWPCSCGNDDLDRVVPGGTGDWAGTLLCEECWECHEPVPLGVLTALAEEKYNVPHEVAAWQVGTGEYESYEEAEEAALSRLGLDEPADGPFSCRHCSEIRQKI